MAFNYSTGFKEDLLDTGSLKTIFDDGFIAIYAGAVPADADASIAAATLLCVYSDASQAPGAGTGLDLSATAGLVTPGAIEKLAGQVWSGVASATNTATFFRWYTLGDAQALSTTLPRIQGTVGGGGNDLFVTNTTYTSAQTYTMDAFSLSIPNL